MFDTLSRLSFRSHAEYLNFEKRNGAMLFEIWRWHETIGSAPEPISLPGVCDICVSPTCYSATPRHQTSDSSPFPYRTDWRLSTACGCGFNSLDRSVMRFLIDDGISETKRYYHVGYHSGMARWCAKNLPGVVLSQFEHGRGRGEVRDDIRYEDIAGLSFADASLDRVIAMEILEHVPDYLSTIGEMARVLSLGGMAVLSFPWLGGQNYDHLIRAELREDGTVHHFMEPEYHGDPARPDGILAYRHFGWRVLDELRDAGFTDAEARYLFGPIHGHFSLLHPVIVATR